MEPTRVAAGMPFPNGIAGARADRDGSVDADKPLMRAAAARYRDDMRTVAPSMPAHRADGSLPAGIAQANWGEFATRAGGSERRAELLSALRDTMDAYHLLGVDHVLVGGSLVESAARKAEPGDVDLLVPPRQALGSEALKGVAQRVHRDVNAHGADQVVGDAPRFEYGVPGQNFLEFMGGDKAGEPRGVVRLSTDPVGPVSERAQAAARTGKVTLDEFSEAGPVVRFLMRTVLKGLTAG